jgi:hypothetical protein
MEEEEEDTTNRVIRVDSVIYPLPTGNDIRKRAIVKRSSISIALELTTINRASWKVIWTLN